MKCSLLKVVARTFEVEATVSEDTDQVFCIWKHFMQSEMLDILYFVLL